MSDLKYVDVVNAKPDAKYRAIRVQVDRAVLNENDDVVGFMVEYSRRREHCCMWVRLGCPDGSEVKRYD